MAMKGLSNAPVSASTLDSNSSQGEVEMASRRSSTRYGVLTLGTDLYIVYRPFSLYNIILLSLSL